MKCRKRIKDIRSIRGQLSDFVARQGKDCPADVKAAADTLSKQLTTIEEALYQTKAKSGQDVLNYPIRLNDKLAGVFNAANSGNMAPSKQSRDVYADIAGKCDVELAKLAKLKKEDLAKFNELVREKKLTVVGVKELQPTCIRED